MACASSSRLMKHTVHSTPGSPSNSLEHSYVSINKQTANSTERGGLVPNQGRHDCDASTCACPPYETQTGLRLRRYNQAHFQMEASTGRHFHMPADTANSLRLSQDPDTERNRTVWSTGVGSECRDPRLFGPGSARTAVTYARDCGSARMPVHESPAARKAQSSVAERPQK